MKISIVIPHYNDEDIYVAIKHLKEMRAFSRVEIIIVDDGSDAAVYNKLLELRSKNIRIVRHDKNRGVWYAIATGFASAKRDIIAVCGADSFFSKEWVEAVLQTFKESEIIAAGGPHINYKNSFIARAGSWLSNISPAVDKVSDSVILNGSGMIVRKSVLNQLGGMDVRMIHSEDLDLAIRISAYAKKNNKKIFYSPKLANYTAYPTTLLQELKRRLRWGKGRFYVYLKHKNIGKDFYIKLVAVVALFVSIFLASKLAILLFLAPLLLTLFKAIKYRTFKLKYWLVSPVLAWLRMFGLVCGCAIGAVDYGLK